MAFSTRFIFGFVTSFRDPDLDFAKQLPGDFDLIFSQCGRSSTKPFDFVFLISWWSSKWWQLSGSQNGPMDINDGILRFFSPSLRFYTINVKNDEDEVDGDGPSWGLDASADRLGPKVKDGDWVTWYPNYRMHGKAHWRWKRLTLQWSHIFSLTSSNTDRSRDQYYPSWRIPWPDFREHFCTSKNIPVTSRFFAGGSVEIWLKLGLMVWWLKTSSCRQGRQCTTLSGYVSEQYFDL